MVFSTEKETEYSFSIQELLYYAFLICTMGAKALGLTEGQRIFSVLIALGALCVVVKILMTQYTLVEWTLIMLLLLLGGVIYLNTHHIEAFFAILMVLGMKNVKIQRACKVALFIWIPCFILTTGLALLGFRQGFVGVQQKIGMDSAIIRYSLGYTHPNVLHMTFLMIVMLLIYVMRPTGRRLIWTSVVLMLINIYIFLYSVSYTGVLSVTFFLGLNIYLSFRKQISKIEKGLLMAFMLVCMLFMVTIPFIVSDSVRDFLDRLVNYRLIMIQLIFKETTPSFWGHSISIKNIHGTLDCSYAYMMMYHGLVGLGLFILSMIIVMVKMLKKEDCEGIAMISSLTLSGVIEQYLANLSFKNIGYFFIGDLVCNTVPKLFTEGKQIRSWGFGREIMKLDGGEICSRISKIPASIRSIFSFKKIFFPFLGAFFLFLVTLFLFKEPGALFFANSIGDEEATVEYIYHESDSLFENSIIIGDAEEGTALRKITWVDLGYEKYRICISVFVWTLFLSLCVLTISINVHRRKSINQKGE